MSRVDLILASSSPRRRDLLRSLGLRSRIEKSPFEETGKAGWTPAELVRHHAFNKALAVARRHPHTPVLGADTVVCLGTRIYGKPRDWGEAVRMLEELQGRTHRVVTGVAILRMQPRIREVFDESTEVRFRRLNRPGIDAYLATVNPLDKAGAYAIQASSEGIVDGLKGSYTNGVGLPMERVEEELKRLGIL